MRHCLRLALALVVSIAAACSTNVPVGFGSGESSASREVVASTSDVWDATLIVLQQRGDRVEMERRPDGGGVMRTGRFEIIIEPLEGGTTRIDLYNADYVGLQSRREAEQTVRAIEDQLR